VSPIRCWLAAESEAVIQHRQMYDRSRNLSRSSRAIRPAGGTTDLSRYAHSTGGDVYYAAHESDLPNLYAQVSEEARHQYTIGYLSTGTDRGKLYHSIEVRIKRSGLSLLTRDGYYPSGVIRP